MANYFIKHIRFILYTILLGVNHFSFSQGNTPCTATAITANTNCINTAGTTIPLTYQSNASNGGIPTCASPGAPDGWYSFTPTISTTYTIVLTAGTITDSGMSIYTSSSGCNNPTELSCDDDAGVGTMSQIITSLTSGTTYFIRIWAYGGTSTGTFSICITQGPPPTPAPTNDNCSGAYTVAVNSSSVCSSQTGGTVLGATASGIALGSCFGTADDDVWYSFLATSTTHSINITNVAGSVTDMYHSVYSGSCGALSAALVCSDPNTSSVSGLTIGNTYFIRVYTYTGTSGQTSTFSVCVTSPPPPPANDEPNAPTSIVIGASCSYTTFTNANATNSTCGTIPAPGCSSYLGGDVWFSVTVPASGGFILDSQTGVITDGGVAIYSGTPCGVLTLIGCDDDSSPNGAMPMLTVSGQTPGTTLYIRFFEYSNDNNGTFGLCLTSLPSAPANDNCTGAYTAAVSSGTACTSLTDGTLLGATASTQVNNCASGDDGNDVWYSFVATSTTHSITINNVAGNTTDLYHSVYAGSCSSIGNAIVCSDPNNSTVNGLTPGNIYYLRVYTYWSAPNANTTFSVCIRTGPPTGACGNPANNDYCSNPATLTQAAGTFSSTTSSIYSSDQSSPLFSIFCGSIENNSWYSFVASGTTASFPFTSITGCVWNDGIQAEVYSVTTNASGCCTGFTSMSNCYNPGTTATGTVSATGLTIGQTYILMVDGYAGDVCNFTVNGWTAIGVLPIELLAFTGRNEETKNKIQWVTATEINSNYFVLEKSKNGLDFESLMTVNAANNSLSNKYYNAFDLNPFENITYYRLNLFDLDGTSEYSNVIAIDNSNLTDFITSARPNPTQGNIEFDINTKGKEIISIELFNNNGLLISTEKHNSSGGYETLHFDLSSYEAGLYLLKVTFGNSGKSEIIKVIKN